MEGPGQAQATISLVSLWNTCVQAFSIVNSKHTAGSDLELLFSKFELERVRLLIWGQVVGLVDVQRGEPDPQYVIDARLNNPETRTKVLRLLSDIERVFDKTDGLANKYGMTKDTSAPDIASAMESIYRGTFKGAAGHLRRSAKDYPPKRRVRWAINDKAKFQTLIDDLRGFIKALTDTIPDINSLCADVIREEVQSSLDTPSLHLFARAAGDHEKDVAGLASRLADSITASLTDALVRGDVVIEGVSSNLSSAIVDAIDQMERDLKVSEGEGTVEASALEKIGKRVDEYMDVKNRGTLTVRLHKMDWTHHTSAFVHWSGDKDYDSHFNDRLKGYTTCIHDALKLYHRKKYLKKLSRRGQGYEPPTDEDYVYFDIESDPHYENANPGTVTVEGFALESWDYAELFGEKKTKTIVVNASSGYDIPGKRILRRLDELKRGPRKLGWNPEADLDDLKEFMGKGTTWINPAEAFRPANQIMDLYSMLNRRDFFSNFVSVSTIALVALGGGDNSIGLWNFLWQVILSKELARRLEQHPDSSMSGLTEQVLASLIISERWLEGVDIVLTPLQKEEESKDAKAEPAKPKDDKPASRDDAFDIVNNSVEIHSLCHDKQVEGLLRFAESMRWPFLNEMRDFAEDAYANMLGGTNLPFDIWDWLFGMVLPGKWASFKIMAALVLCTPSLKNIGIAFYFESGLSLPKQSYWRTRTVLGRVLGCLPGVKSICGWVGPCPPIDGPHRVYMRLKARRVTPPRMDGVFRVGGVGPDDGEETTRLKDGEEPEEWAADIMNDSRWVVPKPPAKLASTCTVETIRVKALPLEVSVASKKDKMSEEEIEQKTDYRASIVFKINGGAPVTYTLYTNPVFVTLPLCKYLGSGHAVHTRELAKFSRNIWSAEDLKDITPDEYDSGQVLVINATGKGAEAVARAWCCEVGKHAIIRRSPGACFTCAYAAAGDKCLGVNVLIWVS